MEIKTVEEINQYIGSTVNPSDNPDTVYELYSVPSFELQHPEIIKGTDIGSSKITVEEGDVLVCKINPRINRVWVVKQHTSYPLLASSEWIVIRNLDIDSDYLKWYFSSPTFRNLLVSQVAGIGGSLTRAQPKQVAKYPVPLVGKEEQRRIAALLDKVSDLIAKRRAQLDKLDLLVKARFVEMFGDCKTNPKGWKTCCLEDIAEVGSSKRVFVEELKEEGIPFYRGTEVGALAEGLTITPELFITEEHYNELCDMSGKPQKGDLLMPSICPDGRIWLVDTDDPFYFKDGRVLWVHGISDNFDPVFLLYTLKDRIMADYSSIASGTTFAELKIFALKKCKVFNVPIELQRSFSSFIQSTSRSKLMIQQSLDKLEILKKALMQQYFG
ncbi:restriction endonuclease subunit S [Flavonifractor hominis]|uniref:Restriction endonuclease subunit S n=1 Tax=Flavonifractor hominis TaxID=3133178 RepID=A0ABV1EV49_9FIRM